LIDELPEKCYTNNIRKGSDSYLFSIQKKNKMQFLKQQLSKIAGIYIIFLFFFVFGMTRVQAAELDTDGDGLTDQAEQTIYGTDITKVDTDDDGYDDRTEIFHGYSPRNADAVKLSSIDSDNDGATDQWEIRLGLNVINSDTDGDGYLDGKEINAGYDPRVSEAVKKNKRIAVTLADQRLAYYFDNVELERFAISGGVRSMPSPEGAFAVLHKVPNKNYGGAGFNFYYPDTKWNLHFTTRYWRYYIHGAYWHNKFGQPMSHGCINVRYDQMERLYGFSEIGTEITIS